MRPFLLTACILLASTSYASDGVVSRSLLTAATAALNECREELEARNQVCVYSYFHEYATDTLVTIAHVPYEKQEGESDVDAAVRTCAGLTASATGNGARITMNCFPCEVLPAGTQVLVGSPDDEEETP